MKILLISFIAFGSMIAHANVDIDCLNSLQDNDKHTYTPIAICDVILSNNIEGKARLNLVNAEVCVIKRVTQKLFSKVDVLLVKGLYQAQSTEQNPITVSGGMFSISKKLKQNPSMVTLETKYVDSVEVDVYDSTENVLTVSRGLNGEFGYNAKLGCRKI